MLDQLYKIVEDKYFDSRDFNGKPIYELEHLFDINSRSFRETVRKAIDNKVLTARFHSNPHIMAFSNISKEQILECLDSEDYPGRICLYPSAHKLAESPRLDKYKNSPYTLELAKGFGQLDYRTFDLSVLEYYRNDPRYYYTTDFIHGTICIKNEYFEDGETPEPDQVLLKTFGFAYDSDLNRYVAVFLRYISTLSPEHQNVWQAKEVIGEIKLHPDYYRTSIRGESQKRLSIFEAFVQELELINEMCSIMGKPLLFRKSFISNRPKEFGFLLRPTASELDKFLLLLDKMMSDNINKAFFKGDIELEVEEKRADGKIRVIQKGTIQLLEAWVHKFFRSDDDELINIMISTFKKVRKQRQQPAHQINQDTFDQNIFRQQRLIMMDAYAAVRYLRLILSTHPAVRADPPQINKYLETGKIWDR